MAGQSSKAKKGGISKDPSKDIKDAKKLMEEARAQEQNQKELNNPDAMETEDVERKRMKTEKFEELFVQATQANDNTEQSEANASGGSAPPEYKASTDSGASSGIATESGQGAAVHSSDNPLLSTETVSDTSTKKEGKEEEEEDVGSDDEDKWSPAITRRKKGLGVNDLRLEGTVNRWSGKMLVMADGPKNASSYRLYRSGSGEMDDFEDPGAPDLMTSRYGTVKHVENGRQKFKYGKMHAKTIQGVAWVVDKTILKRFPKYFPREVDLIKPKETLEDFPVIRENSDGKVRMKVVDLVVKIKWLIDGENVSSWESRDTARRIWGKKADNAIYLAGQYQEKAYAKWVGNPETGRDRSATPWSLGLSPTPESESVPSLTPDRGETPAEERTRAQTPAKAVRFQGSAPDNKPASMKLADWMNDYLELKGITDRENMSAEQNALMMQAWRIDKSTMVA